MTRQQSHPRMWCLRCWMYIRRLGNLCLGCLVALLPTLSFVANAVTTVTVKVTVIASPACIVNNNEAIEVEFGDVITTQVNGTDYRR